MYLSIVDRFVNKLGPVNALVEHLCERLLPKKVAYADHCAAYECMADWGCGVETGDENASYCIMFESGQEAFLHCGC